MTISAGNTVEDRPVNSTTNRTVIDAGAPATGNGTFTLVNLMVNSAGNFKVGTFKDLGNGVWYCHDSIDLGYLGVGQHQFQNVSLAVEVGECIGYRSNGALEASSGIGGPAACYWNGADMCVPGTFFSVNTQAGYQMSIYAEGTEATEPAEADDIRAMLNTAFNTYRPVVDQWLTDNSRDFLSLYDLELCLFFWIAQNVGGGGGAVDLSPVLAAIGDVGAGDLHTEHMTLMTLAGNTHTQVLDTQTDLDGAIGAAKSDILTDAGVKYLALSEDIAQIDSLDQSALDAAVEEIKTDATGNRNLITNAIAGIASILGTFALGSTVASVLGSIQGVENTIRSVQDTMHNIATATKLLVDGIAGDTDTIINKLNQPAATVKVPPVFPGSANVDWAAPVTFQAPGRITRLMDGVHYRVSVIPRGQSSQLAQSTVRYKGLGWLAFFDDNGEAELIQKIEVANGLLTPQSMAHAAACEVYCKPGAEIVITPFTIKA